MVGVPLDRRALVYREDFAGLPAADLQHLAQDLRRAFHLLVLEWLAYMQHLKSDYPYLFSLAIRTNPFDPEASPVIDDRFGPWPSAGDGSFFSDSSPELRFSAKTHI